ncbi:MAG: hypothetical protein MJ196_13090 [Treponemataceae bacterium]|nr:hypothetical protein [Treponemataceae bacterium]
MTDISRGYLTTSYSYLTSHTASGKIAVPVQPSMVVYSQLEHISGYASTKEDGVSVSRVHILNTLIEKVSSASPNGAKKTAEKPDLANLDDAKIDAMIEDYQAQLKVAIEAPKSNPYAISPAALSGNSVNIIA